MPVFSLKKARNCVSYLRYQAFLTWTKCLYILRLNYLRTWFSAKTLSHKEQLHEGLTTELLRQIGHQNAIHWNSSQI